jgi:protein gp37
MPTAISWTDDTWNPVTGCTRVSRGCARCYIERQTPMRIAGRRFARIGNTSTTGVQLHPERLARVPKGPRIFTCSMSDLFHEDVPDRFIDQVFAVMAMCPQHTFLLLTKRAERLPDYFYTERRVARILDAADELAERGSNRFDGVWPLRNLQLGVSVEDRARLPRLVALRATPAALRWASYEPLLEDLGEVDLTGIGWGVIGGESGCGAAVRRFDLQWARALLEQHRAAGIPCFVKQLGAQPWLGSRLRIELADKKGGDPAEWPRDLCVREYPVPAQ